VKIQIGDTVYPVKSPDDLSVLDLLMLEQESAAVGRKLTMPVLKGMQESIDAAVASERTPAARKQAREEHPESLWMFAITIWASRRAAGEHITFADAISFPMRELTPIPEPGDEVADEVDPTRAQRRASAPGVARRAKQTPKISGPRSIPA
jgi:glutathione S-transferase